MESIKPTTKFQIQCFFSSSEEGLQSLTLLYQPIIGPKALSLYLTLRALPQTEENHHLLIQILNLHMTELMELRYSLEASGLLDVYERDNTLHYAIKSPLTPRQFFDDGIMSAFLYVKLGERDFINMKRSLVSSSSDARGVRMTKKFDDVFDVRVLGKVNFNEEHLVNGNASSTTGVEIGNFFDEAILVATLKQKGICPSVMTPQTLKTLNELAYLYKFDVHELAHLIHDTLDPCGEIDVSKLRSRASKQFQLLHAGSRVSVITKEEKDIQEVSQTTETSKDELLMFFSQSPVDFLRFKSGGKQPVPADVKLVEWLFVDQEMPAGVVNVLIEYVLHYTDGNLPKQLVEKMAGQWQRKGIKTTEAAMDQVRQVLTKSTTYQKEKKASPPIPTIRNFRNVTRKEPIPDWFGKTQNSNAHEEDAEVKARFEAMKRQVLEEQR